MKYFSVLYVVLLTVYGQLVIKWRMSLHQVPISGGLVNKGFSVLMVILKDPFVLSGLISAMFASFVWLSIIKDLRLNIAYPIMSLSFVLVFFFSSVLFHEHSNWLQVVGLCLIMLGVTFIGFGGAKLS